MRLNWADALQDLEEWTRLAPVLLDIESSPLELPRQLRLLAHSTGPGVAAALVADEGGDQWVRVYYQATEAGHWQALAQFVTAPAPSRFWSTSTGEPAWVHTTGSLALGDDPTKVTMQDLVILYRSEVSALLIGDQPLDLDGTGIALIVYTGPIKPPLAGIVAGEAVPIWYPPGE